MASFEASADWPYRVAWLDGLAAGAKLGRALVTRAAFMARGSLPPRWAANPLPPASAASLPVPFDLPRGVLNRVSIGACNTLRYRCARAGAQPVHWERFFFPLDRIEAWHRLYGRRGFLQYQCVLPLAESQPGLAALLERVAASGHGAFLAVLKRFGATRPGLLSFPMEGYSLALDFPLRRGTPELLHSLDRITHARGGRVYLAKDACCQPERMRQGYAEWGAFATIRNQAAPAARKFASALSHRLAL